MLEADQSEAWGSQEIDPLILERRKRIKQDGSDDDDGGGGGGGGGGGSSSWEASGPSALTQPATSFADIDRMLRDLGMLAEGCVVCQTTHPSGGTPVRTRTRARTHPPHTQRTRVAHTTRTFRGPHTACQVVPLSTSAYINAHMWQNAPILKVPRSLEGEEVSQRIALPPLHAA